MIKESLRKYLFAHNYLVGSENKDNIYALYTLANKFGIVVTNGVEFVDVQCVKDASKFIGQDVPEAFYKGFPQSVIDMSPEMYLLDQLISYWATYGLGNFDEARHSLFEENIERVAFSEHTDVRKFVVVDEASAVELLKQYFDDALCRTRPLNTDMFEFVCSCIDDYGFIPEKIASKDTAIRLLVKYNNPEYAKHLSLNDVLKVVEKLHVNDTRRFKWNKLNMPNKERKFVTQLIHAAFKPSMDNYEKAHIWKGLLHHIHFKPVTADESEFVQAIRDGSGKSAYSKFENLIAQGKPALAAYWLKEVKGGADVLRHLDYLLSRAKTSKEVGDILNACYSSNPIVNLQLLLKYEMYDDVVSNRKFVFHKNGLVKVHVETNDEVNSRRSVVGKFAAQLASRQIRQNLETIYHGMLGKVYVDESFKKCALPLYTSTGNVDFGTLPTGSVIDLPEGKKFRFFTYWEKVNDVDLSIIGIKADNSNVEFSWRTMYRYFDNRRNEDYKHRGIVFSGDETSGFNGGSEYFDIDLDLLKKEYNLKYLIVNNNVYSGCKFSDVVCKAGYMTRDTLDTGEVFEPKTVQTSFTINCDSTYAHLFAIDVEKRQLVWLNISKDSSARVAATEEFDYVTKYIGMTDIINVYDLATMCAEEVVLDPCEADYIFSDDTLLILDKENQVQVTSRDQEKIMKIMEGNI